VLVEGHFEIETHKLAQVSSSETLFRSENGSNFENATKISSNRHLLREVFSKRQHQTNTDTNLVKLRTLSQASIALEIRKLEHRGSTLKNKITTKTQQTTTRKPSEAAPNSLGE
jgi:hypothetical protein